MSSASISQRSPHSPGASLHTQDSKPLDGIIRKSSQTPSAHGRDNPMSPEPMAQRTEKRTDQKSTIRRPSLAASQKTSRSSVVLGLPSTIDPSLWDSYFDLDQSNANNGLPDNALDLRTLDWIANTDSHFDGDDVDAQPAQYDELLQGDQSIVGLGSSHTQPEQASNLQHTGETNYGLGIDLNPSMLGTIEPYDTQALDPNFWEPTSRVTSQFDDVTAGLSALPGGSSFMSDMSQYALPNQLQYVYPDPFGSLYPANPYFPYTQPQNLGYYTGDALIPAGLYDVPKQEAVQPVRKRKHSRLSSTSENDSPIIKRPQEEEALKPIASPVATRNPSVVSEDASLSKPIKARILKPGQKPKKCEEKPWVRINNTTKGETTRTARINQHAEEGCKYRFKDLPHGDWESTHYRFEYTQNSGMHEFKKHTMSARQIREYITQYPGDNLRIWIQPVASDSARRYASPSHSHCRFEKCPMRKYTGKGTAEVGNYRIAFDEKYKTYGPGVVDPYDCVGFVHLYCMERFLDFAYICHVADVRVDQRVSMEKEPKGHFASAFGPKHHHEASLVKRFIDAARRGRLAETHEFSDYPIHAEYARGAPKPHERTLIYAMYEMNMKHRATSQIKQFILQRKIRPGSFPVHRGDMEVKLVDKKIERLPAFKEFLKHGSKKEFDYSVYYDQFHPEIKERIAECMAMREKLMAQENRKANKRSRARQRVSLDDSEDDVVVTTKRARKRRVVESDLSEEEESISPKHQPKKRRVIHDSSDYDTEGPQPPRREARPSRSGLRQRPRVDYTEPKDISPPLSTPPREHTKDAPATSHGTDHRRESCSNLFPASNDTTWQDVDVQPLDGSEKYMTSEQIDALLNAAYRRKSSTLSNGPCVPGVRSPYLTVVSSGAASRRASFNPQPVTRSKEFRLDDPPMRVASGEDDVQRKARRGHGSRAR